MYGTTKPNNYFLFTACLPMASTKMYERQHATTVKIKNLLVSGMVSFDAGGKLQIQKPK